MTPERKRKLKRLGKAMAEQQSQELRKTLDESNPAAFGSAEYVRNEIAIRKKEKEARKVADALPAEIVERDYVVRDVQLSDDRIWKVPGHFAQCTKCGDALPLISQRRLHCRCFKVTFDPARQLLDAQPQDVRIIFLIARVTRKWWQFWKRR